MDGQAGKNGIDERREGRNSGEVCQEDRSGCAVGKETKGEKLHEQVRKKKGLEV